MKSAEYGNVFRNIRNNPIRASLKKYNSIKGLSRLAK